MGTAGGRTAICPLLRSTHISRSPSADGDCGDAGLDCGHSDDCSVHGVGTLDRECGGALALWIAHADIVAGDCGGGDFVVMVVGAHWVVAVDAADRLPGGDRTACTAAAF